MTAPMTDARLAEIDAIHTSTRDLIGDEACELLAEVRRARTAEAEWRQHHDDACERERGTRAEVATLTAQRDDLRRLWDKAFAQLTEALSLLSVQAGRVERLRAWEKAARLAMEAAQWAWLNFTTDPEGSPSPVLVSLRAALAQEVP